MYLVGKYLVPTYIFESHCVNGAKIFLTWCQH